MTVTEFLKTDLVLARCVALIGAGNGRYPSGNSLLIEGPNERILIDPSTTIADRGGAPGRIDGSVDRILISHAHEDHMAGVATFPNAKVHSHHSDLQALHSLDGFLEVYGMPAEIAEKFAPQILNEFHYVPRLDATGFADGTTFHLGNGLRVEVVHLPGHTRGHCGFLIEPDGVFFVADLDLSAFGPYYGDHWSDLEDFERAIARARDIEARWYVTFHHKGVVEGQQEFVRQLDVFAAVIGDRERRLLEFLREPHTMAEIVAHRFIYRPGAEVLFADHVERTSMLMHIRRLLRTGAVEEIEPSQFRAV
jgi:hydroxyacylglutathione hydrolase